jgi:hypothetical protein
LTIFIILEEKNGSLISRIAKNKIKIKKMEIIIFM